MERGGRGKVKVKEIGRRKDWKSEGEERRVRLSLWREEREGQESEMVQGQEERSRKEEKRELQK